MASAPWKAHSAGSLVPSSVQVTVSTPSPLTTTVSGSLLSTKQPGSAQSAIVPRIRLKVRMSPPRLNRPAVVVRPVAPRVDHGARRDSGDGRAAPDAPP